MNCKIFFRGNAYAEHTKCITEEERYSGKGFVAKEKKGEKKQNTWIDLVQSVLEEQKNAPRNVIRIIETISKHNNTPRKKPKFFNFVKNVCGAKTGAKEIEQAWELISPKLAALSNANQNQNQNKNKGETEQNDADSQESQEETSQDQNSQVQENVDKESKENPTVEEKKLSKKERKEEKKRQKYEAELKNAEVPPEDTQEDEVEGKKGKKKKNRTESVNGEPEQLDGKKNKRKRQDTVNSVSSNHEVAENGTDVVQNGTAKTQKKKAKVDEEAEESMCLHDQNVAKISELAMCDKFDWHAVIMSVLQKKGNELPFKRLQKKVLSEYSELTGREIDDRIADKFIKKLKSAPNVKVDKNRVLLLE